MQNYYDYKKFAILYVDDEEKSLKYFTLAFSEHFRILTATNAQEGFRLFQEHQEVIGILMTDQRMPGEKGVQLLERARQLRPRIVRILATAYSDIDAAIAAVNTGAIYRYVTKPWDVAELETTLRRGLEFFIVQRERDQLLTEKLSVLHNLMITDRVMSLGVLAAGLGHYVRNSLVAVRTFLDLAPAKLEEENVNLDDLRNPNFWKEFYAHVQNQVKRITELLSELGLASEKLSFEFLDSIRLDQVISVVLEGLQGQLAAKSIVVENHIPSTLPIQTVDLAKFRRLFELLLRDEIINLPDHGRLTLNARTLQPSEDSGPLVQLEIHDNGVGMPQEALRSVFDPFFLRNDNPQEFGINLMACYFVVYHHGGRIEVKSQKGQGTCFILTFPLQPPVQTPRQEEQDFLAKVMLNETLWEKLLAGD